MAKKIIWNWQQKDWPNFTYNADKLKAQEEKFIHNSGLFIGAYKHISDEEQTTLMIELMSDEALMTSEIEGEILNRDSVQSSIRRNLGLDTDNRKIPPAEQGISEMMVDLHHDYNKPLSNKLLFNWHKMVMNGRTDIKSIGAYRSHDDPMQVVSGPLHEPKVHFEAPPSKDMQSEMKRFISWFNETSPGSKSSLPPLTRAAIAHLYFVCIHPFEDGNGRIGRAIAEKSLSQSLKAPTLVALSQMINEERKTYYDMLESNNKSNQIDSWMEYFAETILKAQNRSIELVEFLISKAKFYEHFRDQFNARQAKAVERVFHEGISGFAGGLSAENYIRITGTSRATATRDLQELVKIGALSSSGTGKGTRYHLQLD